MSVRVYTVKDKSEEEKIFQGKEFSGNFISGRGGGVFFVVILFGYLHLTRDHK